MNKKGSSFGGILLISLLLIMIFVIGFVFVFLTSTTNYVAGEIIPEFASIGMVDNTNFTDISRMVLNPVQDTLTSFNWMGGVLMVICLFMLIGLSMSYRSNGNYWIIGVFLLVAVLMVLMSIILSNAYSEFYYSSDDLGLGLQDQTLASYLLLYSPLIVTIIIFIAGAIMFTAKEEYI